MGVLFTILEVIKLYTLLQAIFSLARNLVLFYFIDKQQILFIPALWVMGGRRDKGKSRQELGLQALPFQGTYSKKRTEGVLLTTCVLYLFRKEEILPQTVFRVQL